MESILCFLGYLLLNFEASTFRADDVDFFSCHLRVSRLHSRRRGMAGCRCESVDFCRRFLSP